MQGRSVFKVAFAGAVLLATAVAVSPARAQTAAQSPATGTSASPATPAASPARAPRRHRRTLAQMFQEANTTGDGHLTRDQATKMPAVARDFDAIDKTRKGYVTLDDIRGYRHDVRAQRRAARRAANAGTTSASTTTAH